MSFNGVCELSNCRSSPLGDGAKGCGTLGPDLVELNADVRVRFKETQQIVDRRPSFFIGADVGCSLDGKNRDAPFT